MAYDGKIDVNRGVMYSYHSSGMRIFMYLDEPGIYFDDHLGHVPDRVAAEAGFNVQRFAKLRLRNMEVAKVKAALDAKLDIQDIKTVLREQGRYRLVQYDNGMARVETDEGPLTPVPMGVPIAEALFKSLTEDPELNPPKEPETKTEAAADGKPSEPSSTPAPLIVASKHKVTAVVK